MSKFFSFDKILLISALLMAVCGAFFSIFGMVTLFSGAAISIGIMAGAIEIAKLCASTFLYRYWNDTKKIIKIYLCASVFILILVTSMGIFGYLSSAYQQSSSNFKFDEDKISRFTFQKQYLNKKIDQSKSRIDTLNISRLLQENRLNSVLTNDFLTRNPTQLRLLQEQTTEVIKSSDENIKTEQQTINSTIEDLNKLDLQIENVKTENSSKKDIKTFQFVADLFNVSLDTVAHWFIFIIVIIFDPLAISLLLAYNTIVIKKEKLIDATKVMDSAPQSSKVVFNNPLSETQENNDNSAVIAEIKKMFKL